MVFGFGKNKSDTKGKSALRAADEEENGSERSALLGGQGQASGGPASNVRHGRGLLSDDEDDDNDDNGPAPTARSRSSRRRGSAGSDESDDDGSDGELLGSPRQRRGSGSRAGGRRVTWQGILCYGFLTFLGAAFITFAILHIWIGRFVSEQLREDGALLQARAKDAVVYRGPDRVKILSMTENVTTVQLDMQMGVDIRTVFGWDDEAHIQLESSKPSLIRRWERAIVGWGTRRIGQATMVLSEPVLLSPRSPSHARSPAMAQVSLGEPVTLPLWFPKKDYNPRDRSWLRNITLTVPMEVLDPTLMANFINQTMESKLADVHMLIQRADVVLGKESDKSMVTRWARRYGGQSVRNIESDVAFEVPASPDVPKDPSKLVDLLGYDLLTIPHNITHHNQTRLSETLNIHALARIDNPAYKELHKLSLDLAIPFAWPYSVFLHSTANASNTTEEEYLLLAEGVVEPFTIPSSDRHFNVSINGTVVSSANASTPLSQAMSKFVSRFLSGKPNRVALSFNNQSPFAAKLPAFLIPLLKPVRVFYEIPGLPADERDLLKDLKFSNLHVHAAEDGSGGFQLDGQLQGELVMPYGMEKVENPINITEIWPDIVLYDGTPPVQDDKNVPPVPLPSNAFARFRTSEWAPCVTEKRGNKTIMVGQVTNVPLDILRNDVLRKWLAKIIFSGGTGAMTGAKGKTQARAGVRGFGDIELRNLPVYSTFYANKPGFVQDVVEAFENWL